MNSFLCKGLKDCYPECDNLIFYRKNSTQGCYCSKSECDYGYATNYIPEIEINSTPYKIFVLFFLGENWKQNIVFLSLKFDLNIKEARQFETSGKLLLTADAVRIFHVRQQLIERGIEIKIIPEYPYEVWDNNPQGEFPMCTVEARKLKSLLEESQ